MKRIAILFPGNLKNISLGGIDSYVKSIIFSANDCEITVYGICEPGEYVLGKRYDREYKGKRYSYIALCTSKRKPLSLYYTISETRWIKRLLNEYDSIFLQRIEFALPFLFRGNKRVSQIIHGSGKYYEYSYGKLRYFFYSILECFSIMITGKTFIIMNNEKYGVPYYKKKYKLYSERFFYAINPVTFDVFVKKDRRTARKELGLIDSDKIVLYIGRIIDNPKRALLIPRICEELNRIGTQASFIVAGNGPDEDRLKRIVCEMGLEKQVICVGYIDDNEEISRYLNAADVTINMSMYEGTCTSNIESVACGTPVVSTDVGEIRELIQEGINGIIVSGKDEKTIAINMAKGLKDIFDSGIKMNDFYKRYESETAVNQLINML